MIDFDDLRVAIPPLSPDERYALGGSEIHDGIGPDGWSVRRDLGQRGRGQQQRGRK
jgi:hypothetical protein